VITTKDYKKTAKVGDRLEYISQWRTKVFVMEVRRGGILTGLWAPRYKQAGHGSHQTFHEWNTIPGKFTILHKEP
jgi:hypothetical protein